MKKKFELFTICRDTNLKNKAEALGYASMIMFRCRRSSNFHMRTLNFWLTPAIDHQQIIFLFDRTSAPIGFVIWAHLAPDTEERLLTDPHFFASSLPSGMKVDEHGLLIFVCPVAESWSL